MDEENQVAVAAAALSKLEELHAKFMQHAASLSNPKVEGGSITVVDNELTAECLGVKLRTTHRPVVRKGHLMAVEYPFAARHRDEDLVVWTIYLEADGDLYTDSKKQDRFTSSTNSYLAKYLITRLALVLLRSPIFAPRGRLAATRTANHECSTHHTDSAVS